MSVRVAAPAKINLSLRVLGKREDGFHEIRTLFQGIDLGDELRVRRVGRGVTLEVRGPDLGPLEENLAFRAAELFLEASGETQGAHIQLTKWIPAGAGLGGGSSDAAAVLRALSWLSPFPPPPGELLRLGAELGSDVPFFLGESPLARGEGRGERLTPLDPLPTTDVVLALPPVHVPTAEAYRALDRGGWTAPTPGGGPEDADVDPSHSATANEVDPGSAPGPTDWSQVAVELVNDFESVVAAAHPDVARSLDALKAEGASGVLLSGSGAASFGLFRDRVAAERAADHLTLELGWPFVAARTLTRWPGPQADPSRDASRGAA